MVTAQGEKRRARLVAIGEVLELRVRGRRPSPKKILAHLEDKWPGGMVYNTWYIMHTARSMGLLDENFYPVKNAQRVSENARRMSELLAAGGFGAVVAYSRLRGQR